MALTMRLFPGANTSQGFYSCFHSVMDGRTRLFLLKGGPGVGKSSMMKRVARALEAAGIEYELFPCSSDPDSLDAVCAPGLGLTMMDATAPHHYDPAVPGARDTLVSLGDYLDEARLQKDREHIAALFDAVSERFRRATCYLAAASQARRAAAPGGPNPQASARAALRLAQRYVPERQGDGCSRDLFGAAYTPKGYVRLLDRLPRDETVRLSLSFGRTADPLLRALEAEALTRGQEVIALRDPLEPSQLSHLYLPGLRLLFTADDLPGCSESIDADALYAGAPSPQAESDEAAFQLLTARATGELKEAMKLHDELESYYIACMDFGRWQEKLEGLLAQILSPAQRTH